MKRRFIFAILLSLLALTSSPAKAGDNELWGTLSGAALGGFLGSHIGKGDGQLAATGAGVFLGGALGNSIGSSMDRANRSYYGGGYSGYGSYDPYYAPYQPYQPTYVAPPTATRQVIFTEPREVDVYMPQRGAVYVDGGYAGPPPPQPRNHHRARQHCREFTQTIRIDGQVRESYGTACLRPDGSWQIEP